MIQTTGSELRGLNGEFQGWAFRVAESPLNEIRCAECSSLVPYDHWTFEQTPAEHLN